MQGEIKSFLEYLEFDKGCSAHTIAAYRNDLSQFLAFVEDCSSHPISISQWQDIQTDLVLHYLSYLQEQEYAVSTVARKVAAIKSFLGHLHAQGKVAHELVQGLKPPKVIKSLPRPIAPGAVERLLAEPNKNSHPKALRDKALLELLYATGMRVSELVGLNIDDVDVMGGTIICGSGSKRKRMVPVQPESAVALELYLTVGRRALASSSDEQALFLNHRGNRLTRQGLWLIIREYVEAVGISEPVTPHTLRHSFAAHLLSAGANLQEVQKRLGHASASTTLVYRKVSDESATELTVDGVAVVLPQEMNGWQPVSAESTD